MSLSEQGADGVAVAPFRVGLLGHGTVGSAFAALLDERAGEIERFNGRRPVITGVLTRSRGDFEEILADSDLIVEVMGGIEPAREYLLRCDARRQARRQARTSSCSPSTARSCSRRRANTTCGCASRRPSPALCRSCGYSRSRSRRRRSSAYTGSSTARPTSSSRRWRGGSTYADAFAEAQRVGYAEADPSDDVSGRDAAAKMAILARLAFGSPVHLDDVPYEGIEHLHADDLEYARELGLGLKLVGTAERRQGGLSVHVHPTFLYSGHPLASISGPFNAVTVESETITELTLSGPGAGGRQTASAVLGDVVSVMTGGARPPAPPLALQLVTDVESAYYLHLDVTDEPGVLASVTKVLGEHDVSIKSVVQRGMAEHARLVMVTHPVLESRLRAAITEVDAFDFVRSATRSIRVIEEEFT